MTEQTTDPETVEADLPQRSETDPGAEIPQGPEPAEQTTDDDPETFPREYVVKLRQEAADNRVKAQRADDLAVRLHTSLVAATGRLADPSDLAYDDAHLDDQSVLSDAIDDLLSRKPHLASRRPSGDVGQGASQSGQAVDLAGMLRALA